MSRNGAAPGRSAPECPSKERRAPLIVAARAANPCRQIYRYSTTFLITLLAPPGSYDKDVAFMALGARGRVLADRADHLPVLGAALGLRPRRPGAGKGGGDDRTALKRTHTFFRRERRLVAGVPRPGSQQPHQARRAIRAWSLARRQRRPVDALCSSFPHSSRPPVTPDHQNDSADLIPSTR